MFESLKQHVKKIAQESREAFYEGLEESPTSQELSDAYKIFGLSKEASFEEVKQQFRQLSKLYHPDTKAHSDDKQFMRIKEAYDVLKYHYQNS